jgi:hypothetical protein
MRVRGVEGSMDVLSKGRREREGRGESFVMAVSVSRGS